MKWFALTFISTLFLMIPCMSTASAEYPTEPITIITMWNPGGGADVSMRLLAKTVQEEFSKPIVVVNKQGAGGAAGTTIALKAKPDGHTLLNARVANGAILPTLKKGLEYTWDDFVFLGLLDVNPLVFVVNKNSPYKTLNDLAEAIKATPGKVVFCHSGERNISALVVFALLRELGLGKDGIVGVPFPNDGAGKKALLAGEVQAGALNFPTVYDQLGEDGNFRALAVTTPERLANYPHIPTVREAGFPELENLLSWNALYGVKGMPQQAVDKWVTVLSTLKSNQEWLESVKAVGSNPYVLSPEKTKKFVSDQVNKFNELGQAFMLIEE